MTMGLLDADGSTDKKHKQDGDCASASDGPGFQELRLSGGGAEHSKSSSIHTPRGTSDTSGPTNQQNRTHLKFSRRRFLSVSSGSMINSSRVSNHCLKLPRPQNSPKP